MTAHFAIPATTLVLKRLVEARLNIVYSGLGVPTVPVVSTEPPPRTPAPASGAPAPEPPALLLYMHHAGPNPAWRNMYEPHVDVMGKRFARAPLVLDLYYMLAALGLDLEREALLGVGMTTFHRNGILPRPMVQNLLAAAQYPAPPAQLLHTLSGEPLFDPQFFPESITISQQPVDIDMSTKIWSALNSPMRPSAYYLVTTTFLDIEETFPDPKPVEKAVVTERPNLDPDAPPSPDDDKLTVIKALP